MDLEVSRSSWPMSILQQDINLRDIQSAHIPGYVSKPLLRRHPVASRHWSSGQTCADGLSWSLAKQTSSDCLNRFITCLSLLSHAQTGHRRVSHMAVGCTPVPSQLIRSPPPPAPAAVRYSKAAEAPEADVNLWPFLQTKGATFEVEYGPYMRPCISIQKVSPKMAPQVGKSPSNLRPQRSSLEIPGR